MSPIIAIIVALIALAAGGFGGYLYRKNVMEKKIGRTEEFAKMMNRSRKFCSVGETT